MFQNFDALPKMQDGNTVFIDRDGPTFSNLINYLRNDRQDYPIFESTQDQHLFYKELKYWEFPEADYVQQGKVAFPQELVDIFKSEPGVSDANPGGLSSIAEVVSTPIHGAQSQTTHQVGLIDMQVKQRWKELGQINVFDLI